MQSCCDNHPSMTSMMNYWWIDSLLASFLRTNVFDVISLTRTVMFCPQNNWFLHKYKLDVIFLLEFGCSFTTTYCWPPEWVFCLRRAISNESFHIKTTISGVALLKYTVQVRTKYPWDVGQNFILLTASMLYSKFDNAYTLRLMIMWWSWELMLVNYWYAYFVMPLIVSIPMTLCHLTSNASQHKSWCISPWTKKRTTV